MATSPNQNRFSSIREQHRHETAEDYVECIAALSDANGEARVTDIAREMGVSHVTVTRVISRLQDEGFVSTTPYRPVALTEQGKSLADRSRKRHELVLNFLLSLGVSRDQAEIDAEGFEHHASEETLSAMRRHVRENTRKKNSRRSK